MSAPGRGRTQTGVAALPRNRVLILFLFVVLFMALIGLRVVSAQVLRARDLAARGVEERLQASVVQARRGEIFDARGVRLATNVPASRVAAIVDQVPDHRAAAVALSPLVGRSVEDLESALNDPELEWVLLARHLGPETAAQVEALTIPGIVLDAEPGRTYPFGSFASQVLGFTNDALEGNYGVEGEYDDLLDGDAGELVGERDGQGNLIGLTQSTWDAPVDGADLTLTLDSAVQRAIEEILADTIRTEGALGGTIIVQDCNTGAILGMASQPGFDPNHFEDVSTASTYLNPAVSAVYEPGSTFKSLVMAIGIDEGVVTPTSTHNDDPGYFELPDGSRITNFEGSVWGEETMTQVLQRSSNLGAIYVAERIGRDRFYQKLQDFGIGTPSGVDLQGEEQGILTLPDEDGWNDALFYTNAFGQGVAVTPLQLVTAFSAVINGGRLLEPYIVAEVRDGDQVTRREPTVVRQVISAQSSATMREMLRSVVEHEESLYPRVPGYHIGAKTGTAQIPSPDGGYIENATIASIVGFGPVEQPQFTVLVKIDWPKNAATGLDASGPALAKVFEKLVLLYDIPPASDAEVTP